AGAAWLVAATLAQAAPAQPHVTGPEQTAAEAAPQLAYPVLMPSTAEAAGAGSSAGASGGTGSGIPPALPGRWTFTLSPYIWLAGIKSDTTFTPAGTGRTIEANVDESIGDVLSDLNFAIMAGAEARNGRYSVNTDVIYMDLLQKGDRV